MHFFVWSKSFYCLIPIQTFEWLILSKKNSVWACKIKKIDSNFIGRLKSLLTKFPSLILQMHNTQIFTLIQNELNFAAFCGSFITFLLNLPDLLPHWTFFVPPSWRYSIRPFLRKTACASLWMDSLTFERCEINRGVHLHAWMSDDIIN